MEIQPPIKDSGLGVYAKSVAVKPKQHVETALEMEKWLRANNGTFKGEFGRAFAIAHCQVANVPDPIKLFVLDKEFVDPNVPENKKQNLTNCFFEAAAIWNAEILEAPEKLKRMIPRRKVSPIKDGKVEVEIVNEERMVDNLISVPEACMSWPMRKTKNVQRYHTIKVRYQYIDKNMLGMTVVKTFEGWVEGLKAHILQHECDHFDGKNIHYGHKH